MENVEKRIEDLERKVKNLSLSLGVMLSFMIIAIIFGKISFENYASAQIRRDTPNVVASSIPLTAQQQVTPLKVIEAQAFVLRDAKGKMRGMWSAENNNTTFALAFKDKDPSVVMSAGENFASVTITDKKNNKISMVVDDKLRAITVLDDKEGNRFLFGATDKDTIAEINAKNDVRLSMSGKESAKIEALSEKTSIAIAEKRGSLINFSVDSSKLGLSFIDRKKVENLGIETKNQNTTISIFSPLYEKRKVISIEDEK